MTSTPHRKRLLGGGAIGRDVVTLVRRTDANLVAPATFRESRRPRSVLAARQAEDEARAAPPAAPPRPSVDLDAERNAAYERGFAEGQMAAASGAEQMFERFEASIAHLERALDNAKKSADRDAVRLALLVAEKIVRRSLTEDPDALVAAVGYAAQDTSGDEPLRISCDASTARGLKLQIDELVSSLGVTGIEVAEDPALEPGDLMLSRGAALVDARIDTLVHRIEQSLLRNLEMSADVPASAP